MSVLFTCLSKNNEDNTVICGRNWACDFFSISTHIKSILPFYRRPNGNLIRKTISNEIYTMHESQTFTWIIQSNWQHKWMVEYRLNAGNRVSIKYRNYEFNSNLKYHMWSPAKYAQNSGSLLEIYRLWLLLMNLSKCHGAHCTANREKSVCVCVCGNCCCVLCILTLCWHSFAYRLSDKQQKIGCACSTRRNYILIYHTSPLHEKCTIE